MYKALLKGHLTFSQIAAGAETIAYQLMEEVLPLGQSQ